MWHVVQDWGNKPARIKHHKAIGKFDSVLISHLIDNAGYGYYMPLLDVDLDKARKQYEVNVWGVLAVTQAFFPLLRVAKGKFCWMH